MVFVEGWRPMEGPNEETPHPHLLRLSLPMCRALHWVAVGWSLLTITALALSGPLDLLDHRPGGATFEISQRPVFMVLFAIGVLLAMRWEIIGGTIAAFTASGLVVFATQQLRPGPALLVIIAFAVPAVLWIVIDLNDQEPWMAVFGLFATGAAILSGTVVAGEIYDGVFGPAHPVSDTAAVDDSEVEWMWSGAATTDGFHVTAKLDDDVRVARLLVGTNPDFAEAILGETDGPDAFDVARFEVSELGADTQYFYAVETDGVIDPRVGRVRTFPRGPASFTVAVGSDARVESNGAVFDAIRATDPLAYLIVGDLHYGDIDEPDPELFDEIYDVTLSQPAQAALYQSAPVAYVWDDHDFTGNGSDSTAEAGPEAHRWFRNNVPHYPLAGSETPIYQAFTIGRVRFIVTDQRSGRSPASDPDGPAKTMLGDEQKQWFKDELLAANADYPVIVWLSPLPWITEPAEGADHWGGYTTERRELADFIASNRIDGLVQVSGDAHMIAIDDGTNSGYAASGEAGFPVFHAAALDRDGEIKGGPYSEGAFPGAGQFGTITVDDDGGDSIDVTLQGLDWRGDEIVSLELEFEAGSD